MTDIQTQTILDQRAMYQALAKQATKEANRMKQRTTYHDRYANDPDFRHREKERMLIAYYLKKEEKNAAAAATNPLSS
jgi:hypothetical protein